MIVRAVVYRVVTVALVVYIRVIPITALEMVVTGSAHQKVVATLTIQFVVARSS